MKVFKKGQASARQDTQLLLAERRNKNLGCERSLGTPSGRAWRGAGRAGPASGFRTLLFVPAWAEKFSASDSKKALRILVVEDDRAVASFLKKGLEAEHYAVDVTGSGAEALSLAESVDYDLMVLDLMLPEMDGWELLRRLRGRKMSLPVLILTGRNRVEDRVRGLDLGADDYLTKPFAYRELAARVRALLRRGHHPPELKLQVADLELDRVERAARRAGKTLQLTPKEFALLEYLMRNAGRAVTRAMIIEHVWDFTFDTMTNIVDVYINYLRRKVDVGFEPKLIETVRGTGYRLRTAEEEP